MEDIRRGVQVVQHDKINSLLFHFSLKKPNAKGRSGPSLRMLSTKKTRKENKDPKTLLSESHLWRMKHTKVVRDLVRLHHKNHLQVQRGFLCKKIDSLFSEQSQMASECG